MSIQALGMQAYANALRNFQKAESTAAASHVESPKQHVNSFGDMLNDSLKNVNDLQMEKHALIQSFASGETQNVHELMISMQKASLAVSMTAAVRNKVMEAYKELSRIQF